MVNCSRPSTPALVARLASRGEGLDEFRPAVGIAAVIDGVHADEDVGRRNRLGIGQGQRQQHGVPRRDIGDRDAVGHCSAGRSLGTSMAAVRALPPKAGQIDADHHVPPDTQAPRPPAGPPPARSGAAGHNPPTARRAEALLPGDGRGRGRVEPPGKEDATAAGMLRSLSAGCEAAA